MPELGTFGSVRGVPGNGYPYRNPRSTASLRWLGLLAVDRSVKLASHTADVREQRVPASCCRPTVVPDSCRSLTLSPLSTRLDGSNQHGRSSTFILVGYGVKCLRRRKLSVGPL
jgi:hypothetical protein